MTALIQASNDDIERVAHIKDRVAAVAALGTKIKWTRSVKRDLSAGVRYDLKPAIVPAHYRPYCKRFLYYFDPQLNEMPNLMPSFFGPSGGRSNKSLVFTDPTSQKPFMSWVTELCPDMHLVGAAAGGVCVPRIAGLDSDSRDNITDWGLDQFKRHYTPGREKAKKPITKDAIFHYVYGVLHDPVYREKYALNLKREFPRIPFYPDFWAWAAWGEELMDLHIGYEKVAPAKLKRADKVDEKLKDTGTSPKVILKADKEAVRIVLDSETSLSGIPGEAWDYRLGNRCALEWILDQYKEKKPKDPTIREKFNTYRFADHKEKVIDLLLRVTTVSVRTVEITRAMEKAARS